MAALHQRKRPKRGIRAAGAGALAASVLLLGACAGNREAPGMPWLLWAAVRSLAGAPPMLDFYSEPVRVTDTLKFTTIAVGDEHTCALTVDGETYCWGSNRYDQLGNAAATETCGKGPGAYSCSSTPVRVPDVPRFESVVATRWGTCGLDESGAVHCWGYGFGGRNEAGFLTHSAAPVKVPGEHSFSALASNSSSGGEACGLTDEGRVWCWALSDGANGSESPVFTQPALVASTVRFTAIAFSGAHGCGVDDARNAYCWGNNVYGSLGTGASWHEGGVRESAAAVAVQGGLEVDQIVTGNGSSCALTMQGSAYCWGLGYALHGTGSALPRLSGDPLPHGSVPVPVDFGGVKMSTLAAGGSRTCGLTAEGSAYCFEVVPLYRADPVREPVRVKSDQAFVQLAVSSGHACAVGTDALAYCWGRSYSGQVGRTPSERRW